jgi:hypothetical protein
LIKPLLTLLNALDPDQIFALCNKAPEISEEMLRVPDYYDDIDELSEKDADEEVSADEEISKQRSSRQTKKRTRSQSNADGNESSSESDDSDVSNT